MKYLLLLLCTSLTFAQAQKFIPLDNETSEFVSEVNYTLFANKKPIFTYITSKDSITRLPKEIVFDSIVFNKLNYKETGFKKENLTEVVLLTKTGYELDEVIIANSKDKEIVIGEESRFVASKSRAISKTPDFGLLFHKNELKNKILKRLTFFVEKVKYKTFYKVKFYSANEIGNPIIRQSLELNELEFETPVFILEKGTKNKVEINLDVYNIDVTNKDVFVCIELQDYYDENNIIFQPQIGESTKLKLQLSKLTNYYTKMHDISTGMNTKYITNINVMINYDFAFQFFKKPHKSGLVAPAIILYVTKK